MRKTPQSQGEQDSRDAPHASGGGSSKINRYDSGGIHKATHCRVFVRLAKAQNSRFDHAGFGVGVP